MNALLQNEARALKKGGICELTREVRAEDNIWELSIYQ